MANSNGIFKRGSSHYLRVVLPKTHQLINTYKSGKVIVSLGACSYREALTAAAIKRAQILEADVLTVLTKSKSTSTSRNPSTYCLRDIYERWVKSKPRSSDATNTCMRALLLYEEQSGNPPLHLLTRAQGDSFRAWLQEPGRKTSSKTAYDRFTWVKTLLKYAYRDLELIPRHPWEGIELYKETTNQRRPWSAIELQVLFFQPLFQRYVLPKDWRAGIDAAYWIPLIGIYTGARLSELAQLKTSDIKTIDEISTISISNLGINQKVKTTAGIRTIPIHSELIRLGFLNYVEKIKGESNDSLWPKLKQRKDKPEKFGSFNQAVQAYATGRYTGVGVLLTGNGITGVDIDDAPELIKQRPEVKKWLQDAIDCGAHCEISPSGNGYRLFIYATLPKDSRKKDGHLEIYDEARFLTVTGNIVGVIK